jgi:hypothetical protein
MQVESASSFKPNQTQQTDNIDTALERGCAAAQALINIASVLGTIEYMAR